MKTHSLLIRLAGILTLLPFGTANAADPRAMTFPVVDFHPPRGERVVLDNGMILYLLEDHELPLIKINAMIRTGVAAKKNSELRASPGQDHSASVAPAATDSPWSHRASWI